MTKYLLYIKNSEDGSHFFIEGDDSKSSMEEVLESIKTLPNYFTYKVVKIEELEIVETGYGGYIYNGEN